MDRPAPRTLLERLIQEGDRTADEICRDFETFARATGVRATLSVRQLGRWAAGDVDNARPAARRVARAMWGYSFQVLLGSPTLRPALNEAGSVAPATAVATASDDGGIGEASTLYEEMVMATEESARFVRRAGVAVTPELIEQLDADVRQLATEYLRRPPYVMFQSLSARRHDVFELVDSHPRPAYLPDLYHLAGQLCSLLAHACSDLSQPYAAGSHARSAWLCADLSGDDALRAYVRWVQSQIAYWQGDYIRAAEVADAGQSFATDGSNILRLTSQAARSRAALSDERGVDQALSIAAEARDRTMHEGRPAGVFYFPPGKAAYYASEARLSLGGDVNARRAVDDATEALELFNSSEDGRSQELVAAAQLDLASAHLALSRLDAVEEYLQPVLTLAAEVRTMPIIQRMVKVHQVLNKTTVGHTGRAAELNDQITLFCAYPAACELPAAPD